MSRNEKIDPRRYALISLLIASLACASTGVTALLIGLVNMQLFTVADVEK